jgi:hypothetical protein
MRKLHIPQNAASQMLLNKGIEGALTAGIMGLEGYSLECVPRWRLKDFEYLAHLC